MLRQRVGLRLQRGQLLIQQRLLPRLLVRGRFELVDLVRDLGLAGGVALRGELFLLCLRLHAV